VTRDDWQWIGLILALVILTGGVVGSIASMNNRPSYVSCERQSSCKVSELARVTELRDDDLLYLVRRACEYCAHSSKTHESYSITVGDLRRMLQ